MSEHAIWNELGNLYALSGSYDQAIRAYRQAIAITPAAGEPHHNLGQVFMQLGRFTEAVEAYADGAGRLTEMQQRAVTLHRLGDAHLRLKQYAPAMEAYQHADELVTDIRELVEASQPCDLLLHIEAATSAPAVDDSPAASTSGMEVLPLIEELTPWWFDGQTQPEEAPAQEFELWPLAEPSIADPNGNIIFTEPLKWDLAVAYRTPQESAPLDRAEALNGLLETVSVYTESESRGTALAEICEAETVVLVAEPEQESLPVMVITDAPEVTTEVPEFSSHTLTSPAAVQYVEPAPELPTVELSPEERAGIQADIEKLKRTLEINPRNPVAWDTLGGNYKALGQYDEAIHAYRKAVSLDSSKAFYFHHLGLVFAAVGNNEDAIGAFERVIEIDPNHSLAHATLGGYYRKNGKEELAQAHITKARGLLATDENEYNRACMEAICGNTDQSLELLELALKNKQTYVNWARKDPDLDFIRNDPRFHALLAEYAARPAP